MSYPFRMLGQGAVDIAGMAQGSKDVGKPIFMTPEEYSDVGKYPVQSGVKAFSTAASMLPIGAAYYQDLFKIKVWGVVNVGILFALSEFVVAWTIAWVYSRKANKEFDAMAQDIINDVNNGRMK